MKTWRNPYLIVRTDGVVLYDVADNAEIRLSPTSCFPPWRVCPRRIGRTAAWSPHRNQQPQLDQIERSRATKACDRACFQGAHIAVEMGPRPEP